ncbi:hypothetical protein PFISCL1PPCAC_14819, partial [Pristionchus fissidentatus]
ATRPTTIIRRDKDSIIEKSCLVCDALTKEFHFGAVCCVACGAFFRRAVSEGRDFKCRNDGNCEIGGNGRASCRSCRYAKCIRVGMDPAAVQPSRGSIGVRRKEESTSEGVDQRMDETPSAVQDVLSLFHTNANICSSHTSINAVENFYLGFENVKSLRRLIYSNGSLSDMLKGLPPKPCKVALFTRLRREALRVEAALMSQLLNTCRSYASFSLENKEMIFKNFAIYITVLEKHYITMRKGGIEQKRLYHIDETYTEIEDEDPQFPPEAASIGKETLRKLFVTPILNNLTNLCVPMREMGMDDVDFAALATWILFDPDIPGFPSEHRFQLDQARSRVHNDWLSYYIERGTPDGHLRIARCLALLPVVQSMAERCKENFHLFRVFGLFDYDEILGDLYGFPKSGALPSTNSIYDQPSWT